MSTTYSRREFFSGLGAATSVGAFFAGNRLAQAAEKPHYYSDSTAPLAQRLVPVISPGIAKLPYELDNGVKVFRLRAEPVRVYWPDMRDPMGQARRPINCWGYNGSMIGPTIEVTEGDWVRIHVENHLPDVTTIHWHGLHLPIEMDGVPGISQEPIKPGETFTYEFPIIQSGTFFYHPHTMQAKQIGLGMMGFFIIHPANPEPWHIVDRDYAYFMQMWRIHPQSPNPDTLEMADFNFFTMNGRPGPDIVPMQARLGERVRIRMSNLSMMTHPMHLHGHTFKITDWGGGMVPPHLQIPANTIDISAAEVRGVEFVAERVGKWVLHCHFPHHVMNDMDRPPLPAPGEDHAAMHAMDLGGMHTYIEITE